MTYSIVTVPRTGSHYLQERLLQHTGVLIYKYHNPQPNKIITIARDPRDTIASDLSMASFFRGNYDNDDVQKTIDAVYKLYQYVSQADITIDYDDLISFPYETTKALAEAMGIKIKTDKYITRILDDPKNKHMTSSKNLTHYQEILCLLEDYDISPIYDIYHKMLAKAIKPRGISNPI